MRVEEAPPVDPTAIDRAYRFHRARRRRRIEHRRETRHAHVRFYGVLALLFVILVAFAAAIWHVIQQVFGL